MSNSRIMLLISLIDSGESFKYLMRVNFISIASISAYLVSSPSLNARYAVFDVV